MTQNSPLAPAPYADSDPFSSDDGNAINLRNVTKVYRRRVHALQGIAMHVKRGEVFGLLGPNGAGKSTLVKIMLTVVRPTRAEGTILGKPVGHKATLREVGYLPENHRFPRYLTGRQVIEFFSALAMVDRPTRRRRASELLETVSMAEWGDTRIGQYSKGMLQRIGLATALGADPNLVVLDEPTDGVDPAGRRDIRDVLLRLRGEGKTVFINSHQLSELESVCDRVAILVQGRVSRQGTLDELTIGKQFYSFELAASDQIWSQVAGAFPGTIDLQKLRPSTVLEYAGKPGTAPPPMRQKGTLADQSWFEFDGSTLRVGQTEAGQVQWVVDALRKQGIVIRRMQLFRPTLEDLFMEAVNGLNAAQPGAKLNPKAERRS